MPDLSHQTLTRAEPQHLRWATVTHHCRHPVFSPALGAGFWPAGVVGLDVGTVFFDGRAPQARMHCGGTFPSGTGPGACGS